MLPPLTSSPTPAGNPSMSAIHRKQCRSISEPIGDGCQPPTFAFTAEAARSASALIGAADKVM